jgi:hypothetical protein
MSKHRHTPEGFKVLAVLATTPDTVVENIGSVLVCLDIQTHPEDSFVVFVNGGTMDDGRDSARFADPLEAFDCANAIAREAFSTWIHDEGHNVGPLEQDADIPVVMPADDHGRNE